MPVRVITFLALPAAAFAVAQEPARSPFDALDPAKLPVKQRPPRSAPNEAVAALGGQDGQVGGFAVRHDGGAVALLGMQADVRLYETATGKLKARLPVTEPVSAAFTPSGKSLAVGDSAGAVRVWDVSGVRPALKLTLNAHKDGPVWSVAVSPDGEWLASSASDGTVKLWSLTKPAKTPRAVLSGHKKHVRGLAFSPDGATLASAGADDNTCRLWDVAGERAAEKAVLTLEDKVSAAAFAPDGKTLAVSCFDRSVKLYALTGAKPKLRSLVPLEKSAWTVEFAPDGQSLLGYVKNEKEGDRVVLWGTDGEKRKEWAFGHRVHGAGFAPDGRHVLVVNEDSATVLRLPK